MGQQARGVHAAVLCASTQNDGCLAAVSELAPAASDLPGPAVVLAPPDRLGVLRGRVVGHSTRKAVTGDTRVARRAGT